MNNGWCVTLWKLILQTYTMVFFPFSLYPKQEPAFRMIPASEKSVKPGEVSDLT
jgi:hypothetical protein